MAARNVHINAVSRLAYRLAGGSKVFYAFPKDRRSALREHAQFLYTAGSDFVTASLREDVVDGFVYAITHPSFPDYVKIGCAIHPHSRLKDYQTYCPQRAFKLEHYVYTSNRTEAEAWVHSMLADVRAEGEWFRAPLDLVEELLDEVREFDPNCFG